MSTVNSSKENDRNIENISKKLNIYDTTTLIRTKVGLIVLSGDLMIWCGIRRTGDSVTSITYRQT